MRNVFLPRWQMALWGLVMVFSALFQFTEQVELLRYDRADVQQGAYWLLFSGHFVHLNWSHWGLNMGGLAIVAFFFSGYYRAGEWLFIVFFTSLFVGLAVYWLNPDIFWYVGLSGVLHGLFIAGVIVEIQRFPASGWALILLISGKLLWETVYGPLPGSESMSGGRVVVEAHLYGFVGGLIAISLLAMSRLIKK